MAGVLLHQAIIRNTPRVQRDSDHIDVWHVSAVSGLPDRTGFLVGDEISNPAEKMVANVREVSEILERRGQKWWAAVPCATFHSPRIFDLFQNRLALESGYCGVTHIVNVTISHLLTLTERVRKVGVLSTLGSYRFGVWRDPILAAGLELVELPPESANALHSAIYDPRYGLKAIHPPASRAEKAVLESAEVLIKQGAQAIVLGCTELPFVAELLRIKYGCSVLMCDPIEIQAKAVVEVVCGREYSSVSPCCSEIKND